MTQNQDYYVYVLFRPWSGEPFYIGKGKGRRAFQYAAAKHHHNPRITRVFEKSARLGLDVPVVKISEYLTERAAFEIEIALIAAIGRGPCGPLVNFTDGGEGASGNKLSAEAREKIRLSALGNKRPLGCKRSPETIEKLKAINSNRSAQTRKKMSDALKGRRPSDEAIMKMAQSKRGVRQSQETIAKRALAITGRKISDETKEKISSALKGNPNLRTMLGKSHSIDTREKIRSAAILRESIKKEERMRQRLLEKPILHQQIAAERLQLDLFEDKHPETIFPDIAAPQ